MKNLRKLFLLTILTIFVLSLTGCGDTKVELNNYITIDVGGYDSRGIATYSFDYDSFEKDYEGKIKVDPDCQYTDLGRMMGKSSPELLLLICVSQSLDKTSGLSNGDTITLKWDCKDGWASQYYNCDLVYSDIRYTVYGLQEED